MSTATESIREHISRETFDRRMSDYRKAIEPAVAMKLHALELRRSPMALFDTETGNVSFPEVLPAPGDLIDKLISAAFDLYFPNKDLVVES